MWKFLVPVLALISIAHGGVPWGARSVTVKQEDVSGYRLPNSTMPTRYDVELTTHVHNHESSNQFDFDGKVTIAVQVLEEEVSTITLHRRQLTITHVKLTGPGQGGAVIIDDESSFSFDEMHEFLIIEAGVTLEQATYVLEITYQGVLRDDNGGFYRSSYTDEQGKIRWIATTQFESTDARHAFPCYDEPAIRTPIGLKITHGTVYHAISNMPVVSVTPSTLPGYSTTLFQDTPLMQTYLLAFVVSDFTKVEDVANKQAVYAVPASIANGNLDFALEAGIEILKVLEDYVGIAYTLPKLDQIGIPDFAAGAMENWGLVTYREEVLEYNSTKSPMSQLKRTAAIIAHEYAHQYFGDLVSPAWWSYLWLNEGFATMLQYWAAGKAYPSLHIEDMFTIEQMHVAFQSDALESTRPMTSYVETPAAISALFDDIAYDKAGSVLRQLQHAFGEKVFATGLNNYLTARQFKAAAPEDLAEGLQKATTEAGLLSDDLKVVDIVKSWADQKGYPVLHVSRDEEGKVKLQQERYMLKPTVEGRKATWYIPYNIATQKSPAFDSTSPLGWLTKEEEELATPYEPSEWIIVNKQQTGYYRVNYDENLWALIATELRESDHKVIHHLNRAQLIDDSLNLARSGHLNYEITLHLLEYLVKETEYIPWAALNSGLVYLNRMLAGSSKYDLFQKFVWYLVEPAFTQFGMESKTGESMFDKLTRNILINWACTVGSEQCLSQASSLLSDVIDEPTAEIDPNLQSVIYCNGLRSADRETFLAVWERMQNSHDALERSMLISSLGCIQNAELQLQYLNTSLDVSTDNNYRPQERNSVLSAVYSSGKVGLETGMKFLSDHSKTIDQLFNGGSFGGRAVGSAIAGMARRVVSTEQKEQFDALINKLTTEQLINDGEATAAAEIASENIEWTKNNFGTIESWLEENYNSAAAPLGTTSLMMVAAGAALVMAL